MNGLFVGTAAAIRIDATVCGRIVRNVPFLRCVYTDVIVTAKPVEAL